MNKKKRVEKVKSLIDEIIEDIVELDKLFWLDDSLLIGQLLSFCNNYQDEIVSMMKSKDMYSVWFDDDCSKSLYDVIKKLRQEEDNKGISLLIMHYFIPLRWEEKWNLLTTYLYREVLDDAHIPGTYSNKAFLDRCGWNQTLSNILSRAKTISQVKEQLAQYQHDHNGFQYHDLVCL